MFVHSGDVGTGHGEEERDGSFVYGGERGDEGYSRGSETADG